MFKRHDLEFQMKRRNMMFIFFTVFTLLAINIVILYLIFDIDSHYETEPAGHHRALLVYQWVISFQFLILFSLIILFKSSQDCLQGISLLDYKFKTSSFQLYKENTLNVQKTQRLGFLSQASKIIDVSYSDLRN